MSLKYPPTMMRAFGARAYSSPDRWETLTTPKPSITSPNDVLIQVHAADLSLVDAKMTSGAARFVVPVP
jgi:NADPH:quinone reductase-like Zn-dependent oxidoreductase